MEERTRELSSLLEISHTVASTLQLKPLLGPILDQLKIVVDYTGSAITTLEGEDLVLIATRGPDPEEHLLQRRFSLKHMGPIWEVIHRGETVIIDNVRSDTPLAQAYRESVGELLETTFDYIRSWMAVPLMLKERVIGMLSLSHSEPIYYTPRYAGLALAIANQAAVAIENARLYEQAQALAAVEERQRLARELHDSVSQALYGISLGVHTARLQLDRDPSELAESLDYVLELAEAALIEMRALIFELRPESLETEGLVTALTKQMAVLHARQGIIVKLDLGQEPDVPLIAPLSSAWHQNILDRAGNFRPDLFRESLALDKRLQAKDLQCHYCHLILGEPGDRLHIDRASVGIHHIQHRLDLFR